MLKGYLTKKYEYSVKSCDRQSWKSQMRKTGLTDPLPLLLSKVYEASRTRSLGSGSNRVLCCCYFCCYCFIPHSTKCPAKWREITQAKGHWLVWLVGVISPLGQDIMEQWEHLKQVCEGSSLPSLSFVNMKISYFHWAAFYSWEKSGAGPWVSPIWTGLFLPS